MSLVLGVIGLLWCGVVTGLLFFLEMIGGAGSVANFEAESGFAYSSNGGVLCAWC